MSPEARTNTSSRASLLIAVCLVAVNMRMSITGVGPMLDSIALAEGTSPAKLGLLASVPMLAWALASPLAQSLANKIGLNAAVSYSLAALFAATIWRSLPGTTLNLWLGTALIGVALAIVNVLLPASIKRDFGSRVPLVMGVYSALLGASGALGAAIVAPIALASFRSGDPLGWRWALLATGITVPVALIVWMFATRRAGQLSSAVATDSSDACGVAAHFAGTLNTPGAPATPPCAAGSLPGSDSLSGSDSFSGSDSLSGSDSFSTPAAGVARRVWQDPVAWWIALYMGSQSWVFYIYAMWLSSIILSRGASLIEAGGNVTFFHTFGVIGSLIAPFIMRGIMHRLLPVIIPLASIASGAGLIFLPDALMLWLVLAGLCCGASLSISLTYVAQRSSTAEVAGAVSGMAQSFGYLIAGIGPILFGWIFGLSGTWALPFLVLLTGGALQLTAGIALLRQRLVLTLG